MDKKSKSEPPGLDDPRHAAHAWRRFRGIMWGMAAVSMATALVVLGILWWSAGPLPWIFMGLIVFGVWSTVMMAALLMGLMFLSSGTGHDEKVEDRFSEDILEKHEEE